MRPPSERDTFRFDSGGLAIRVSGAPEGPVFDAFFGGYEQAFVLPNETEDRAGFAECLALNAGAANAALTRQFGPFAEFVLIAEMPGPSGPVTVGGANFICFPLGGGQARGGGPLVVHLNYAYVAPAHRRRGHLARLLDAVREAARRAFPDAPLGEGGRPLVFFELNDPFRLDAAAYAADTQHSGLDQQHRIAVWARLGARVLDVDYVQPALSRRQSADETLVLCVLDAPGTSLPPDLLREHLRRFFGISVLKGRDPEEEPVARRQLDALAAEEAAGRPVALLSLARFARAESVMRGQARSLREWLVAAAHTTSGHVTMEALPAAGPSLASRAGTGTMFLTVSLLAGADVLEGMFGAAWSIGERRRLRDKHRLSALPESIEPLFDDIADRRRHLYVDEFLLGASQSAGSPEVVTLDLGQVINWNTEGDFLKADLGTRTSLPARCRMFWFVHSNGALSYHVSVELDYAHTVDNYFALSTLQKLIFAREGTEWMRDDPLVLRGDGKTRQTFWAFVRESFERDASELFGRFKLPAAKGLASEGYYGRMLLPRTQEQGIPAERRVMILMRDPYFFDLLQADRRAALSGFGKDMPDDPGDGSRLIVVRPSDLAAVPPERMDYYFLSGFFQNIIDFLRQDTSEVKDGTDPVYPTLADPDGHFIVYANQTTIFEIVRESRSLDLGQAHIGTCPYLFLVHIMTFHNESLVRAFERAVVGLVEKFEGSRKSLAVVLDQFYAYRLEVFDIKKFMHFNVLRYDTERTIYEEVMRVRGIAPRMSFWEDVLEKLQDTVESRQQTVDSRREQRRQEQDDRINRILLILTGFSVLQVTLQASDTIRKLWNAATIPAVMDAVSIAVMCGLLIAVVWRLAARMSARRNAAGEE